MPPVALNKDRASVASCLHPIAAGGATIAAAKLPLAISALLSVIILAIACASPTADSAADGYPGPDAYSVPYSYGDTGYSRHHRVGRSRGHRGDSHGYPHPHAYPAADGDAVADAYADARANPDAHAYPNSHSDTYSYAVADAHAYPHADPYAHADTDADAHAHRSRRSEAGYAQPGSGHVHRIGGFGFHRAFRSGRHNQRPRSRRRFPRIGMAARRAPVAGPGCGAG